jgi:hypothetical protein
MINLLRIAILYVILGCTQLLGADLETFFVDQKYTQLILSPDGKHLAIVDREPQWHLYKGESDAFWGQDDRIETYRVIANFLAENLK